MIINSPSLISQGKERTNPSFTFTYISNNKELGAQDNHIQQWPNHWLGHKILIIKNNHCFPKHKDKSFNESQRYSMKDNVISQKYMNRGFRSADSCSRGKNCPVTAKNPKQTKVLMFIRVTHPMFILLFLVPLKLSLRPWLIHSLFFKSLSLELLLPML